MVNLKDYGISVQTVADLEKIGLQRVRVFFKLVSALRDIKALFNGLYQNSGLRSYARSMYTHVFDCEFAIPSGTQLELQRLLQKLQDMKLISNVEIRRLVWKDILMLKTQFFDYSRKEWDVDFSTLSGNPSVQISAKSDPERFDFSDLLVIKELELNAWAKIVELAKKTNVSVGDTAYHLNRHVFERRLIKSFKLRWDGTREAWLKHSLINKTYLFRGISNESARHAMSIMTSNPFTWSHMRAEDGAYIAEVAFPLSQYSEGTQYMSSQLRALDLSPEVSEKDWSCLSSFTIPYMLYNKDKSAWDFSADRALKHTLQIIKTYSV